MTIVKKLQLPCLGKLVGGILTQGFQHLKAWFAAHPLSRADQALVGERFQAVADLHRQPVAAHRLCRFIGPAANKNAESCKESLLAVIQQVVAPINRASDGLLAGWEDPCAAGQRLETAR